MIESTPGPWHDWIGKRVEQTATLAVQHANLMAVTLDREPSFAAGDELPPGWHWLYFPDLVKASDLGADGHPALGVTMPPVPLPRRMWAGGQLCFTAPLILGSQVVRQSVINDVISKQGRSGPLYFVEVEHRLSLDGVVAVTENQTIVYRELTAEPAIGGAVGPTDAQFSRTWKFDSVALFRYSALTFNGHRIHYDVDYARQVEGYPNLVVHGPLLATLLMEQASAQMPRLRRFDYQARSPIFLPDEFSVNGRDDGAKTSLWVAAADGRLAMAATAYDQSEGTTDGS